MNPTVSNQQIERFLSEHVKGLTITPVQLRAHLSRPESAPVAFSDKGPTGSRLSFRKKSSCAPGREGAALEGMDLKRYSLI